MKISFKLLILWALTGFLSSHTLASNVPYGGGFEEIFELRVPLSLRPGDKETSVSINFQNTQELKVVITTDRFII